MHSGISPLLIPPAGADAAEEVESSVKAPQHEGQQMVWYASYGSNMWTERFLCYIQGGKVRPG